MNKIYILVALFFAYCATSYAQEYSSISINPVNPTGASVPEATFEALEKKLDVSIASNGYGTEHGSRFVLVPSVEITTKDITSAGMILQKMIVTLVVGDVVTGQIYASTDINTSGIGDTEEACFNKAFSTFNAKNPKLVTLLKEVGPAIVSYFENNKDKVIKKANELADEGKFEEALQTLATIPSCVSYSDEAGELAISINETRFEKQRTELNNQGLKQINNAKAKWNVRQDYDGAAEALTILADVDPALECYAQAQAFIEEINAKLRSDELKLAQQKAAQAKANWEFKMRQYEDKIAMEKQAQADRAAILGTLANRFGRIDIGIQKEKTSRFGFAK